MSKQYGFMIDTASCTGCKTCQVACKDYRDTPLDVNFRRVYEYVGGSWKAEGQAGKEVWTPDVFAYYTSIACNHCSEPVCVTVCAVKAMSKDDNGFVKVDSSKCVACKSCANACPYGAPQFNQEKNYMTKCDGCYERVEEGQKPVCVDACPLRALDFGPIEEMRKKYGELAGIAPLPDPIHTKPNLVIKPGRTAKPVGDKSGFVNNPKEI